MATQYLGTIDDTSFGGTLARSFTDQMDKEKQQKLAMAMEMIKSGQYQPTPQGQQAPQGFGQRLLGGLVGPQVGGANMNVMGQNYQQMTPQIQAQQNADKIKMQMKALGMGQQDGASQVSSPEHLEKSISFDPSTGDMKMTLKSPDSMKFEEKQQQFNQREWDKISKEMNPNNASPRTALGKAGVANYQANRALTTLMNPMVTNQEAGNVMADIAGIYQGGSPTDFGMSHQQYTSVKQQLAATMQYLSGKPQDAIPAEIKQRLIETLNQMKKTNYQVIGDQLKFVEGSKRNIIKNFPDEWNDAKKTLMSDEMSPENQSAKQWDKVSTGQNTIFNTPDEAMNSGLPEGSIVTIGGKKFRLQK